MDGASFRAPFVAGCCACIVAGALWYCRRRIFRYRRINNLGELVSKFGNAGLIGVVAAAIVAFYIIRKRDHPTSDRENNASADISGGNND